MARPEKFLNDRSSDETGSARDEDWHEFSLFLGVCAAAARIV
jgi:hypothetical protein